MPLIALGLPELLIIGGVFVLMFGAKKLPGLGGAIGEGLKNFKKGIKPEDEEKKLEGEKADEKKPS